MKKLLFILLLTSSFLCAEEKLFVLYGVYGAAPKPEIDKLLADGWEVKTVTPSATSNSTPYWVVVLKKDNK